MSAEENAQMVYQALDSFSQWDDDYYSIFPGLVENSSMIYENATRIGAVRAVSSNVDPFKSVISSNRRSRNQDEHLEFPLHLFNLLIERITDLGDVTLDEGAPRQPKSAPSLFRVSPLGAFAFE